MVTIQGVVFNQVDKVIKYSNKSITENTDNLSYVKSKYEVLENSDALVLLTEWKEFRSPDFELIKSKLKTPIIFDGRNQYNNFTLVKKGFEYYQIGKNK